LETPDRRDAAEVGDTPPGHQLFGKISRMAPGTRPDYCTGAKADPATSHAEFAGKSRRMEGLLAIDGADDCKICASSLLSG
jgi:hypothetical protein